MSSMVMVVLGRGHEDAGLGRLCPSGSAPGSAVRPPDGAAAATGADGAAEWRTVRAGRALVGVGVGGAASLAESEDGRLLCAAVGPVAVRGVAIGLRGAAAVLHGWRTPERTGLAQLAGGFVFAVLDRHEQTLTIGRDALGNQPGYFAETPAGVAFSSSLTALARLPWVRRGVSPTGLLGYFASGFVPAPHTIYEGIHALLPGELVTFGVDAAAGANHREHFARFVPAEWPVVEPASDAAALDRLEELLAASLDARLRQHPGAAAYLSGGTDTSLIAAVVRRRLGRPLATVTLGLPGSPNDESHYARAVADHLGTEHHEHRLTADEFLGAVEGLAATYGQPFADVSAIPTAVIAGQIAGRHPAMIAGDGPDFMFGNFDLRLLHHYYSLVPRRLHEPLADLADAVIRRFFRPWISPNLHVPDLLRQDDVAWVFSRYFRGPELARLLGRPADGVHEEARRLLRERTDIPLAERLLLVEHSRYGLEGVLVKSTAVHDALGVPLLRPYYDPPLVAFVRSLPVRSKLRRGRGRWLQKRLLARFLPPAMIDRPKRGFVVDFREFGAAPLEALCDRYLAPARLAAAGLLDVTLARATVDAYFAGDRARGPRVWALLMFELWRERLGP